MTHIVGVRLVNWKRFRGEHVLELGPGTYAVVAEDVDDEGRSNWLGKSALLEAIRWALEGHKPRTVDALDELISWGEDHLASEIELSDGTFVSRRKRRGHAVDLQVCTGHGDRTLYKDQAQEQIWQALGFTPVDLLNTAYAEQKQLAHLITAKGAALHDVVTGWLRLDLLVAAADAVMAELATVSKQLHQAQVEASKLQVEVDATDRVLLTARIQELELQHADTERRRLANAARIREHDAWLVLEEKHKAANRSRVEWLAEIARIEKAIAEAPQPVGVWEALKAEETTADRDWAAAASTLRQRQQLAVGLFDGTCPVNGDACPVQGKINSDRTKNAELFANSKSVADAAKRTLDRAVERRSEHQSRRSLLTKFDDRLLQARHSLACIPKLEPLPEEPDVVDIVEGIGVSLELDEARRLLATHTLRVDALALTKRHIAKLEPRARTMRAAAAVLGPEQAQKRIAERAVQTIERQANADLNQAGIDLSLSVRWGRETQQPAKQCPACGTAFPASTRVKVCEGCLAPRGMSFKPELRFRLSNVSGAAEDLAGLALRCAAFKWLRVRRQSEWSVAILDEPFGSLDRTNKRALASHVQTMLAGTFNQALLVAHDPSVLDGCQHRIVITGQGKWSSVRVVA